MLYQPCCVLERSPSQQRARRWHTWLYHPHCKISGMTVCAQYNLEWEVCRQLFSHPLLRMNQTPCVLYVELGKPC